MWNRRNLKNRAKTAFRANYWKSVLVALILMLLVDNEEAGSAAVSGARGSFGITADAAQRGFAGSVTGIYVTSALVTVLVLVAVLLVVLKIFVFNLLEVGGCRFFCENTYSKSPVRNLLWGFDSGNWFNIVKIIFFRDIKLVLWSLLFIIPGIVKSYEYRMVPYILSENPSMDSKEAFLRSREMMDGNKWDAFILDLSFIGWKFLGAITFGLVDVFWTNPYQYAANAELYMALRNQNTGLYVA